MTVEKVIRPTMFKLRQTEPGFIRCGVSWCFRYSLSLLDLEELLTERGVEADHTTIWQPRL
jgi:transposase-like protein